jgi:putative oxidoreductase
MSEDNRAVGAATTRDSALLWLRLALGAYLSAHGAQKLFGSFEGYGLDRAGEWFEDIGLKPGKVFAALAGCSELGGGALIAAGAGYPLGPIVIMGDMAVAALTHVDKGPLTEKGGFELPVIYLTAAMVLLGAGQGRYSVDRLLEFTMPKNLRRLAVLGTAILTTYSGAQVIRGRRALDQANSAPDTAESATHASAQD